MSDLARELRDNYPAVDVTTAVFADLAGVACCVIPQERVLAVISALDSHADLVRALEAVNDNLAEAIHVAFRKASSHEQADIIWKAIRKLPPAEWSNIVQFILEGCGVTAALAKLPPAKGETK